MTRWGFIGAGSIARESVGPAVHESGSILHAVASRDGVRAAALGPVRSYTDYPDLLADADVDVVYVALHNSLHAVWVERALNAGKHVLCEKPLGLCVDEVDRMAATATKHSLLLVEASWNRWHPRTRDLHRYLAAGEIGVVRRVVAAFDGLAPAPGNYRYDRALGGGALLDVGCYAAAAALAAFGWGKPQQVEAVSSRYWAPGSADVVTDARLQFDGGGVAEIHAGLSGGLLESLEVWGTTGHISLSPPAYTAGRRPSTLTVVSKGLRTCQSYAPINPYVLMVSSFATAAHGGAAFLVPLQESRILAETLDMIFTAAAS